MPQKNTIKEYAPESYYHVYSRGVNKAAIFKDRKDFSQFVGLFERYLGAKDAPNPSGGVYPSYRSDLKLASYCLMKNHIHLLVYQDKFDQTIKQFMSSMLTSYSKYFNNRHRKARSLFESRYKARRIDNDAYLLHITRYIHMNPRRWQAYTQSSLQYAFSENCPSWLDMSVITVEFNGREEYLAYLSAYQSKKEELEDIKDQLANE